MVSPIRFIIDERNSTIIATVYRITTELTNGLFEGRVRHDNNGFLIRVTASHFSTILDRSKIPLLMDDIASHRNKVRFDGLPRECKLMPLQ